MKSSTVVFPVVGLSASQATAAFEPDDPNEEPNASPRVAVTNLDRSLRASPAPASPRAPAVAPSADKSRLLSPRRKAQLWRVGKVAVGAVLFVTLGWSPLRALLYTTSVEAVVNARVQTILSPIEGAVETEPDGTRSWADGKATPPPLVVRNAQADHAYLDELKRQYGGLQDQLTTIAQQAQLASDAERVLEKQVAKFRTGRLNLLDARVKAQDAEVKAASARVTQSTLLKTRAEGRIDSGGGGEEASERAHFDLAVAVQARAAAEQRLAELKVERDSIERGVYVGDSYNDTPSSMQRLDALQMRTGELNAQAEAVRSQMTRLQDQIAEQNRLFSKRAEADLALPARGQVWELLTAPGEHVAAGQDLIRVLDCSSLVVNANVDENVYNQLAVGDPVKFRPSDGDGDSYDGVIVNLTGASTAQANLAVPISSIHKTLFYVTISAPALLTGGCPVGRTGSVTFGSKGSAFKPEASSAALGASLPPQPRTR
jgi:multidrug resistance efflux pump